VAIDTVAHKTGVIRGAATATAGREPGGSAMADVALFSGWYMRCTLASGDNTIVTTGTRPQHFVVINR
jgi:hypothetical protein